MENEIAIYLENLRKENWKKQNEKTYNNPIIVSLIKEIDRIQDLKRK